MCGRKRRRCTRQLVISATSSSFGLRQSIWFRAEFLGQFARSAELAEHRAVKLEAIDFAVLIAPTLRQSNSRTNLIPIAANCAKTTSRPRRSYNGRL